MYARVTVVQCSPDKIEQGTESFKNSVLPVVKDVDGYKVSSPCRLPDR
jgi:hypothetical protein